MLALSGAGLFLPLALRHHAAGDRWGVDLALGVLSLLAGGVGFALRRWERRWVCALHPDPEALAAALRNGPVPDSHPGLRRLVVRRVVWPVGLVFACALFFHGLTYDDDRVIALFCLSGIFGGFGLLARRVIGMLRGVFLVPSRREFDRLRQGMIVVPLQVLRFEVVRWHGIHVGALNITCVWPGQRAEMHVSCPLPDGLVLGRAEDGSLRLLAVIDTDVQERIFPVRSDGFPFALDVAPRAPLLVGLSSLVGKKVDLTAVRAPRLGGRALRATGL